MSKQRNPEFLSPEVLDANLRVGAPAESAGGLTAVKVALTMSVEQMGLARTAKVLRDVNQKDGFDCPGCAWPDPEDY